jgi:hypothetical protein
MLAIEIIQGKYILFFDQNKLQHVVKVLGCNQKKVLLGISSYDAATQKIIHQDKFPARYFDIHGKDSAKVEKFIQAFSEESVE